MSEGEEFRPSKWWEIKEWVDATRLEITLICLAGVLNAVFNLLAGPPFKRRIDLDFAMAKWLMRRRRLRRERR